MKRYILLGDVHGDVQCVLKHYRELEADEVLVQLGDLGFADTYKDLFPQVDPEKFKVVAGNHEEYPELYKYPHYLGDWGTLESKDCVIAFCRGGFSIDGSWQLLNGSWYEDEELTVIQGDAFLEFYNKTKPDVMLTHVPPDGALEHLVRLELGPTRTGQLFDEALKIHQPAYWYHGHMHQSKTYIHKEVIFKSLGCKELY